MSVLIFTEHSDGKIKKSSLEAISYGVALAKQLQTEAHALVIGQTTAQLTSLGTYGIKKILQVEAEGLEPSDTMALTTLVANAVDRVAAEQLIFSNTLMAKGIAPRVAVRLNAGLVSGAVSLPELQHGFVVKKTVFSGKAFTDIKILTEKKIITVGPNAFGIKESPETATIERIVVTAPNTGFRIRQVNKATGTIPLAEAERVISGGRGLKGPENWGWVEELAQLTGSATACSRAVADAHWRPHHEHVGQTGLAIAPNLYFAIGISGAIQHLAGVNRSKTIVVINKDPEAPFFKAADYGIVGDAFEVMPKIIEAVKALGQS